MPQTPRLRIAVLRALQLGDMLCALPALRALRLGFPDAEITLIALPWARPLAARWPRYVDEFVEFPGFPGIPEREWTPAHVMRFLTDMQTRRYDIAVQLHGSGSHLNELVLLMGAERAAVFAREGDAVPAPGAGWNVPWPTTGSEVERLLELPRAMGCPADDTRLELPVTPGDREALASVPQAAAFSGREYVCVHPGARFPSRRWSAARFAAAADALADRGLTVVLTGTDAESAVVRTVQDHMRHPAVNLTGMLDLGAFAALVSGATLVLCNDTGMSHVAAAVGTRSVVISSGSDARRWAPLDTTRHRVLWHDVPCRPCMNVVCPTQHECASGVSVDDVLAEAATLLERPVLDA